MGTGEEIYDVARRSSGIGLDGIGEVFDKTCERLAAEVYEAGFEAESLAGIGSEGQGLKLVLTRNWQKLGSMAESNSY